MPDAERTRSLACSERKHASKSPQVRRNSGIPCAMVYGLWRALPGVPTGVPGLIAPVALRGVSDPLGPTSPSRKA